VKHDHTGLVVLTFKVNTTSPVFVFRGIYGQHTKAKTNTQPEHKRLCPATAPKGWHVLHRRLPGISPRRPAPKIPVQPAQAPTDADHPAILAIIHPSRQALKGKTNKSMSDATNPTTTAQTVETPGPGDATGTTTAGTPETYTKAQLETIIKDRLAREQSKAAEAQQKAVDAAEAKVLAEQGKFKELYEKQQADLTAHQAKVKALELAALRQSVASRVGLPAAFVGRLQGETEQELEADARTLLAALPKPTAPNINSGAGGQARQLTTQELTAQRRETDSMYVPF
jgi:hypothetical protein